MALNFVFFFDKLEHIFYNFASEDIREKKIIPSKSMTMQNNTLVKEFIASLEDEQSVTDSRVLIEIMQRISQHEPKLWNVGTIGFDSYHYKYDSGREGDSQILGFYPRKGKLTIYLMDGTARHARLLARLGKHSTSRVCVYIKRLGDIELPVLEQILQQSYQYIKSQDGQMQRVS